MSYELRDKNAEVTRNNLIAELLQPIVLLYEESLIDQVSPPPQEIHRPWCVMSLGLLRHVTDQPGRRVSAPPRNV